MFLQEFRNFGSLSNKNNKNDRTEYSTPTHQLYQQPNIFTPNLETFRNDKDDKLPLLEELEICPIKVFEKSLAVMNPFRLSNG